MGTCTIIALGTGGHPSAVSCFVPIKDAIRLADSQCEAINPAGGGKCFSSVRVYSEGHDSNLTLIYIPK